MPREPTQQELQPEQQNHAQSTIVPQTNLPKRQHGEPYWKMSQIAHHLPKTKTAINPLEHFHKHTTNTYVIIAYYNQWTGSNAKEIIYMQQKLVTDV